MTCGEITGRPFIRLPAIFAHYSCLRPPRRRLMGHEQHIILELSSTTAQTIDSLYDSKRYRPVLPFELGIVKSDSSCLCSEVIGSCFDVLQLTATLVGFAPLLPFSSSAARHSATTDADSKSTPLPQLQRSLDLRVVGSSRCFDVTATRPAARIEYEPMWWMEINSPSARKKLS